MRTDGWIASYIRLAIACMHAERQGQGQGMQQLQLQVHVRGAWSRSRAHQGARSIAFAQKKKTSSRLADWLGVAVC